MAQSDAIDVDSGIGASPAVDNFTPGQEANAVVDSETKNWPQEEGDTVALIHTP